MTLKKMGTEAVVRHIAELLKAAGGRALLVGGCVRGEDPRDSGEGVQA